MPKDKPHQLPPGLLPRRGFMFILSSPSGAGKTTLSRLLLERGGNLVMSVSVTTRPKREGEHEGEDYYFITKDQFHRLRAQDSLLESAEVFGNCYGTPEKKVMESLEAGVDVLFDIDWQGTEQLMKRCRDDVVSIFILPPSMEELERRLRTRAQDTEEVVARRMEKASDEISHWKLYDYVIINHDVEESLDRVLAILKAERQKRDRQHGLEHFVNELVN